MPRRRFMPPEMGGRVRLAAFDQELVAAEMNVIQVSGSLVTEAPFLFEPHT